jgi:hypothetical protein
MGDKLKVAWAAFFQFKLGSFVVTKEVHGANTHPCLKLKGQNLKRDKLKVVRAEFSTLSWVVLLL